MHPSSDVVMTVRLPSEDDVEAVAVAPGLVVMVVCPLSVRDVVTWPLPAVTEEDMFEPPTVDPDTRPAPTVRQTRHVPSRR